VSRRGRGLTGAWWVSAGGMRPAAWSTPARGAGGVDTIACGGVRPAAGGMRSQPASHSRAASRRHPGVHLVVTARRGPDCPHVLRADCVLSSEVRQRASDSSYPSHLMRPAHWHTQAMGRSHRPVVESNQAHLAAHECSSLGFNVRLKPLSHASLPSHRRRCCW
jgi:hypothetical protein